MTAVSGHHTRRALGADAKPRAPDSWFPGFLHRMFSWPANTRQPEHERSSKLVLEYVYASDATTVAAVSRPVCRHWAVPDRRGRAERGDDDPVGTILAVKVLKGKERPKLGRVELVSINTED